MTQGTRIALVLLVLLVLGTGAYWLSIGLRTPPATLVDGPSEESGELEQTPAVDPRRGAADDRRDAQPAPTPASGAGRNDAGSRSSASRREAGAIPAPMLPADGSAAAADRESISPDGPVRPAGERSSAARTDVGPELQRSTFLESPAILEVGGKADDAGVPGFTVVTPVGPAPDPTAPPRDFTPVRPPVVERSVDDAAAARRERESRPPARVIEPAAADGALHVIEEGDTFVTIAALWFGDRTRWDLIQQANPGVDPNRLRIGQRITLPPRSAGAAPRSGGERIAGTAGQPPARAAAAPSAGAVHVVRPGDTLYALARSAYNDGSLWRVIYEANRSTISDPTSLRPGVRLTIPAR